MVGLLVMISLSILLAGSLQPLKDLNYMDTLSLSTWASSGVSHSSLSESGSHFNKMVDQLFQEKKKNDKEDKYWVTDTMILEEQTQLLIPDYYRLPKNLRPDVQPFDPRFTLAFYYNFLRVELTKGVIKEAPFHWADWMDMSVLNPYLFNPDHEQLTCELIFDAQKIEQEKYKDKEGRVYHETKNVKDFCVNDKDLPEGHNDGNTQRMGFNVQKYFGRMTPEKARLAGKAYLYSSAEPPRAVVFLTNDGFYSYSPTFKSKLLRSGLVDGYMKYNSPTQANTLKMFKRLKKEVPPKRDEVINDYEVKLSHEDFVIQPIRTITKLQDLQKSGATLTKQQQTYMESLRYSLQVEKAPPKYFSEARIFENVLGDHYDWRFFNGIQLGSNEQVTTLHKMVRVWLSFCRMTGVTTWLAHGSLLSWYWNGIAFPWDNDVDVQVPIRDLEKLSINFNQSLVVEDPNDGFGRYFLDCGTFITLRGHANGNNNIDARFIDIDTGLYVDITALAVSADKAPERYDYLLPDDFLRDLHSSKDVNDQMRVYNCRNRHFSHLSELSPLVRSYAEGEVAYIPKRYSDLLTTEYKDNGMLQKYFRSRLFMPQLRLWVHQDDLRFFLRHRKEWLKYYLSEATDSNFVKPRLSQDLTKKELTSLLNFKEHDLLELLQNDDILKDYIASREMTLVHENEIMHLLFGKSTARIVSHAPDFRPLKYDPFLHAMRQNYNTYEKEVERYKQLYRKFTHGKDRYQEGEEEQDVT